ncbi:class I SAM-dependent methyltransferase [Enterobacter pseudoroggenkampii]|uniref:class I SAM-dependent methyltransferase n=1 Tax=Enterobacterales TaxID=91347 RepID=UPI000E0F0967|nr:MULTISPECIES: class I SAM-dependent methyltransferase [Enterobacterales]NJQ21770.1 class I SAM-dependent methyltransferase [Pantoea sp. LS15]NKF48366.1 class I SAM-dependent methyltransferase [Pantoea sp. LS15]RDK12927.1 class I SAM-dependent methyltransferase [Enterobacter sp. 9-2]WJW94000.1 class I SAM-dependent methyltransferase [Enterobacter pseudoroggenkampii]
MTVNPNELLTEEIIANMSYPDFVALMRQDNTPPGAEYTIDHWIKYANINKDSYLLDLACSTGFSSRECYKRTGSSSKGIDISDAAVKVANDKASELNAGDTLEYIVADACNLPFKDNEFTHVLGGCNFAFIQDRVAALKEVYRCLKRNGIICVANFYYRREIPEELINDVYNAINFRPDPSWNLHFWHQFFSRDFTLIKEENHEMESQSFDELKDDIYDYIFNRNEFTKKLQTDLRSRFFERLLKIREPLNKQRDYQGVTLQLWRKK